MLSFIIEYILNISEYQHLILTMNLSSGHNTINFCHKGKFIYLTYIRKYLIE